MANNYYNRGATFGNGFIGGVNQALRVADFRDRRDRYDRQEKLQLEDRTRRHEREDAQTERLNKQQDRQIEAHAQQMENMELNRQIAQFNFADAKDKKNRERIGHALTFSEEFQDMLDGNDETDGAKFLGAANGIFSELIGEGKTISGVYPIEDQGVALELDVDDGKGGVSSAPMTQNRSSDANDPVVILPWSQVFQTVDQLNAKLKEAGYDMSSKENRTKAFDAFHALTGNTSRLDDKRTEAQEKRKLDREYARRIKLAKARNLAPPAEVQTVEWVIENIPEKNGRRLTPKQAWDMTHKAKSNPDKFLADYVADKLKEQKVQAYEPGDPEYMTPAQMATEAKEVWAAVTDDAPEESETTVTPTGRTATNPQTGQRVVQMSDGSWADAETGERIQ